MRTVKTLFAAGLLAVALPAAANAQWYVGLDAGVNWTEDSEASGNGRTYKGEYDTGFVGLGQAGYAFPGGSKAEFELGYRKNDHESINGVSANGDTNSWSLMINGLHEFLPQEKIHPFLGLGIGYAHVDTSGTSSGVSYEGDGWEFAYQGIAGLAYDIDKNWALKAQYRYFATLDYDVTASNGLNSDADYHNHSILVGFSYKFGPAAAPAPVPAPVAAAPAPMPAPVVKPAPQLQKNFLVFFDFNKADITPEASKVITQAATAAKDGKASRIDLTGHTDRSGSDKYNMALSLKRGNAVKDALVKQGVPANSIAVVGKGESIPLVATPDGAREPQNRRVEIVLP